ncbi:MAG: methyltransferase domain-containing protein [Candidatus Parcubacteria bacterium]|nr:methyltransferase domain-containing protein [Candidatus Parcubacteria bacterium]
MFTKLIKEILAGKSLARSLANFAIEKENIILKGKILDLGGRALFWKDNKPQGASYLRFIKFENTEIVRLDIDKETNPNHEIDFEKDHLPYQDGSIDALLAFNLLEHVYDHRFLTGEMFRILKKGGVVAGSVPFLVKIHPDPQDFFRYSEQALERIFKKAGFSEVKIGYAGAGPFTAHYSQIEFIFPRYLRIFGVAISLLLDKIILKVKPSLKGKFPLGYIFILKK